MAYTIKLKRANHTMNVKHVTRNVVIRHNGRRGPQGSTGAGVAEGGTANQVLVKDSSDDFDTSWHTLAKGDVGLGNVDNTSDANKPVSTAQQTALDAKVDDSQIDVDDELTADSDSLVASQKAIKAYVSNHLPTTVIPSNLIEGGHSYMDPNGVGITNVPTTKYSTGARAAALLGIDPGKTFNLAVSGAALRAQSTNGGPRYLENVNPGNAVYLPQIPKIGMFYSWIGINDLALLGDSPANQNAIQKNYRAIICRMKATAVWDYNDPTVATTGTWTATTYDTTDPAWGSGAGCWGSSTVGDKITITLPTDICRDVDDVWVDLGFVTTQSAMSGTFTIAKNGVTLGTTSTDGGCFYNTERGSHVYRINITAAEAAAGCVLTATIATVSGSNPVYFDYWQLEATTSPLILLGEITVPPNPTSLWAGITIDEIDTANDWIRDVIDEFDDEAIQMVYLDDAMDGQINRANYQTANASYVYYNRDGLHPNDRGALRMAQEVAKATHLAINNRNVGVEAVAGYYSEEEDPITSIEATIYHGSGSGGPLQLVSDFDGPDSNTTPAGWTPLMGSWGTFQNELAVVNDKWPYPTYWDTFNRQDGAVGNSWTTVTGTWDINSSAIRLDASTASIPLITWGTKLDASGNGYVEATVGAARENFAGIVFRYQDSSNYWHIYESVSFGGWVMSKTVAGVTTIVQNAGMGASTSGTVLHLELNGADISIYNNSTFQITKNDSALQTARTVGLRGATNSASNPTFDNYKVNPGATSLTNDVGFNAIVRDFGVADNIVQFTVGQERNDFNGAIFRYVDTTHYLSLYMSATFGGWVFANTIGSITRTHSVSMSNAIGKQISIAMSGTDFNFYVDGTAANAGDALALNVDATGGTFNLTIITSLGTATLTNQAYNIPAATLQTNLRATPAFAGSTVSVSGGVGASGGTATYYITTASTLATTVGAIVSFSTNAAGLSGGASTASIYQSVTRGASVGTWHIGTGVNGTKHGLRVQYGKTLPYAAFDDYLQGFSLVDVPDNAYFRSDTDGTLYGPFSGGAYTDSIPWLPYNYINAKGDLIVGTADNAAGPVTVGANDTVLTADSAQPNGVKWAAPSAGDASTNTSSSVDNEVALFSGTGGKTLKRATTTGLAKLASGVLSAAAQGTDYYAPAGTDVAVTDGGTGSSTASGARTNLGLGTIATQDANNVSISGGAVTGITDLAIADGGTGASTAANAFTALKQDATQSATGVVELATAAEINTGTDSTRAMPIDQFVASNRNVRYVLMRVVGDTTNIAVATTVGGRLECPYAGTITEIGAYVDTAGTTGTMTIDVNKNGTTLMNTNKISIETGEGSSRDATTQPTLTTTSLAVGDFITVDVDAGHTTPAKGLVIRLGIRVT